MTTRPTVAALLFAVLWTVFMIWWSGDTGPVNIAILSVCGVCRRRLGVGDEALRHLDGVAQTRRERGARLPAGQCFRALTR